MPAATTQVLKEGRYSVEQELSPRPGRSFFQAYDTHDGEAVSIVAVGRDAATGRSVLSFDQLTAALARFNHTYALGLKDSFVEAGVQYLVTDLIDGPDMGTVLEAEKCPFLVPQVAFWGESILEVLHRLHTFRPATVFRSVAPEALIMRPDGDVSLLLSEMFEPDTVIRRTGAAGSANESIAYAPLEKLWNGLDTASQNVIIKQYDEASERALKQELDARSDIFSVGATLYHLVTGRQPVDALERSIEMIDGNPDPLETPHKIDPTIPVEVSDVIVKAMAIRREYRFDSAAIMRQVLRTAVVRAKERGEEICAPAPKAPAAKIAAPLSTSPVSGEKSAPKETNNGTVNGKAALASRPAAASSDPVPSSNSASEESSTVTSSLNTGETEDDLLGILTSTPPSSATPTSSAKGSDPQEIDPPVSTSAVINPTQPETKSVTAFAADPASIDEPELRLFSETNAPGSSRGVALAGAAALLCIAGLGGWFYFGKASPASVVPAAIEQPVKPETQAAVKAPEPAPSVEPAVLTESDMPAAEVPAAEADLNQPSRVGAPAQRTKKPVAQPSKPAQKKAVTVDDLINDN